MAFQDLDELLARYPHHLKPLSNLEALGGAGGYSGARLWRYRAPRGLLVLRAWPSDGPGRARLEKIHRWLFLTSPTGLTPVPLRDNSDRSIQEFQGILWELTPWLPGKADPAHPPELGHLQAAFAGLAALHERLSCESSSSISPGLAQRRDTVDHLIRGGFDTIETAVAANPASADQAAAASKWLSLARSLAPTLSEVLRKAAGSVRDLQPCLRDARPEHFLFEHDRLSGIVDFGAMGIDCVAADLARLIGDWLDGDPAARVAALAAYERIRPLQPAEIPLLTAFESSADLLIGQTWLNWCYLEHRRFEDPHAVSNGLARGLKRLERLALATRRGRAGL